MDDQPSVTATPAVIDQTPKHSVSVAAAIIDQEGRFLAIRRADNNAWEPPGGVLELDEAIESGLLREVEEETGLRVEPVALTGVYKNMQRGIVALVFRCRMLSGSPRTTDEVIEFRWLALEELGDYMTEAYRTRLVDAAEPGSPRIRAHDGTRVFGPITRADRAQ